MPCDSARPPASEASANSNRPKTNTRRRPSRSAARPPRSRNPANVTVYAVAAHWRLASVLHALSDPMRLQIVADLAAAGGERACNSFNLPIVKSTCTHHFKVLREAGLIRQRVVGTSRVNSLRRDDLDTRFPGLLDSVLGGIA